MNDEILKLAHDCGMPTLTDYGNECLERIYRTAYNKAIEDAANELEAMVLSGETSISEVSFAVQYLREKLK